MSKSVPYTRHNEVPRLETRTGHVKSLHFNHVQTGLHRLHEKLRYQLPGLKYLDLILQKDAWIIVDSVLHDMPIVAWTNFKVEHRDSIHEPIECEIRLFHYAAHMIIDSSLEAMELLLGEELSADVGNDSSDVLVFKKEES